MTVQVVESNTGSYLLVNDRGEPIGRIARTRFALEKELPADTVFLKREGPEEG